MLNIQTLRVLTIAASFLFIPAFIYGVASVWSILFATAVGLYSKISLQNIINQCDMVQEPQLESWHVKSAVLFLLFQILVIAAAPQILYLFIYCAKNCIVRQNYDHDFLSGFSTFFIQKQSIFSEEKMIFLSATLFSSILMLLTFCMFSWKSMYVVMKKYHFKPAPRSIAEDHGNIAAGYRSHNRHAVFFAGVLPLFLFLILKAQFNSPLISTASLMLFSSTFYFIALLTFTLCVSVAAVLYRLSFDK